MLYVTDISRRKCFFVLKIISENISREMGLNLCESTGCNMFLKRMNLSQDKLQVSYIWLQACNSFLLWAACEHEHFFNRTTLFCKDQTCFCCFFAAVKYVSGCKRRPFELNQFIILLLLLLSKFSNFYRFIWWLNFDQD